MTDPKEVWKEYRETVLSKVTDFSVVFTGLKKTSPSGDGWISALCPLHSDKSPSFGYNRNSGKWVCFAGCGKGSAFDYIMLTSGIDFKNALLALGDKFSVPRPEAASLRPPISETLIKKWVDALSKNSEAVQWIREDRGLSDETLEKYQIGWDPKRKKNTIPIRDQRGNIVNVRLYNSKAKKKMVNYVEGKNKYGSPARLFGLDELIKSKSNQVIICEGEWDRMMLQQEGFCAVTSTHGCDTFRPEWIKLFSEKDVVLLMDCDKAGQAAARKITMAFKTSDITSIRNVIMPLRGDGDDKDVTDYFHTRGLQASDLQKLIASAPVHSYKVEEELEKIIELSSFTEVENKDLIDKKIRCPITVCGETSEAFHAVEEFRVTYCPKMQKNGCYECKGVMEVEKIRKGSQEYIGSCMTPNNHLKAMLREYSCKYSQKTTIDILKRTTIKEFFCHQKVNRMVQVFNKESDETVNIIDGEKQELMEKRVYYLSSEHPKPGNYMATGWIKSHPKTQQITLLIDNLEFMEDDYESFDVKDNIKELTELQSISWGEKLDDLTEHVTRIYEREEILLSILLTFVSPRWIPFNSEIIRGWLVSVIVGDSGSGKTQTYQRISEFMNIGDCFSGLTGSRTGLAYAMVEHKQKGWQVRIGRYPANSRKILAVDEAQFIPQLELRTISKAMEEGFLQIDRVQSKGYESQTRLILIANPNRDYVMDSFSFGCRSLASFLPPTIIRRIDIAVFANTSDLKDLNFINKKHAPTGKQLISSKMMRALVYWSWNLTPDRIVFSKEAEQMCLDKSREISEKFGYATDIPLVTISDFRKNIARVSAAFAVFSVSTDPEFDKLFINPDHVTSAESFFDTIYSCESASLDDYSNIMKMSSMLTDYDSIKESFIQKWKGSMGIPTEESLYFNKIIFILRTSDAIRRDDLSEQSGTSVNTIRSIIKLLKSFNMIDTTRDGYVKKPKFNKFIRRFIREVPEFFEQINVDHKILEDPESEKVYSENSTY